MIVMTIIKMQQWMLIVEKNEHSWNSKCALHVRGLNYTGRSSVIWFVTHMLTCWLADSGLEHKQTSQRMAFPWGPDRGIQKTPTRRSKKEAEKLGSQGRIKRSREASMGILLPSRLVFSRQVFSPDQSVFTRKATLSKSPVAIPQFKRILKIGPENPELCKGNIKKQITD